MALRPKQQRFVEEFMVDFNATQAAIRAGYSTKTARVIGPENLLKPAVAAAIVEAQRELSQRVEVTIDDVVRGLYREATRPDTLGGSSAVRRSAWVDLGRYLGMFVDLSAKVPLKPLSPEREAEILENWAALKRG